MSATNNSTRSHLPVKLTKGERFLLLWIGTLQDEMKRLPSFYELERGKRAIARRLQRKHFLTYHQDNQHRVVLYVTPEGADALANDKAVRS